MLGLNGSREAIWSSFLLQHVYAGTHINEFYVSETVVPETVIERRGCFFRGGKRSMWVTSPAVARPRRSHGLQRVARLLPVIVFRTFFPDLRCVRCWIPPRARALCSCTLHVAGLEASRAYRVVRNGSATARLCWHQFGLARASGFSLYYNRQLLRQSSMRTLPNPASEVIATRVIFVTFGERESTAAVAGRNISSS